ncbi:TIGR00341 family protein [Marinicauda algicola]|uniref:TIGR00341 family protein n=1 Tax=Marinicauda algicola TaxID=2029849 RepID=A0A4V3RXV7_9PROT|nr:TIGR00341 family protein [Marinicauda algicola]TGY87849.1 TIGR00341 family protein [Marinicauda algicola]
MRLIELSMPDGDRVQQVLKATLQTEPVDHRLTEPDDRGRRLLRLLFKTGDGQKAIDAISAILEDETDWQLVVIPIEASLPKIPEEDETRQQQKTLALREEIYDDISRGGRLNRDYLLLTLLSTLVVVFGMAADNVAVVIGAMVIAPLLGPILAFSFGSALGDLPLMLKAARTAIAGLSLGLAVSFLIGLTLPLDLTSQELMTRTVVGLDSPVLALAAGAAAALSIVTGLPAALVGVMVAVALLPPAAAAGLFAGAGLWMLAARALLLLFINVVSVNLAALVVFFLKGVRPRTWLERRAAKRSVYVNGAVWFALIVALTMIAAHFAAQPAAVLP